MYNQDWIVSRLAQERRRDLLQQAEQDRLARLVGLTPTHDEHKFYHFLDWAGARLVSLGEELQAKHAAYHTRSIIQTPRGEA
jgi:hypothetical protein